MAHTLSQPLITERQLSQLLSVSLAAVRRWRLEHRGPAFVKIERAVRYRPSDVEEYVARRTFDHIADSTQRG